MYGPVPAPSHAEQSRSEDSNKVMKFKRQQALTPTPQSPFTDFRHRGNEEEEEEEEEIVTFRIDGQHVPASNTTSTPGENELHKLKDADDISRAETYQRVPLTCTQAPAQSSVPIPTTDAVAFGGHPSYSCAKKPQEKAMHNMEAVMEATAAKSVGETNPLGPASLPSGPCAPFDGSDMKDHDGLSLPKETAGIDKDVKEDQEMDELNGRLSEGLSLKYDFGGEHCPKYSQREVDLLVGKRVEEAKTALVAAQAMAHTEEMASWEAKLKKAEEDGQRWKAQCHGLEHDLSAELKSVEGAFAARLKETQDEVVSKEIQLRAVTAQLADMQQRIAVAEREGEESRQKLEEAGRKEARLVREMAEKLEAEKARRVKDVMDMKDRVAQRAQEQFAVAQEHFNQLASTLEGKEAEVSQYKGEMRRAQEEAGEALRQKDDAVAKARDLEAEAAALRVTAGRMEEEKERQARSAEEKMRKLRTALEKMEDEKSIAIKDREQAYESLSRTAVSLQEHKRKAEEFEEKYNTLFPKAMEHASMCEELLVMVESLNQKLESQEGK
ncbi:hypothetical protein Naga_100192g11 [Nannochloropsis gaditana]|uniref:Uncharacterized protein n=3 Tax=Nannochloropsis gaditana TaxID=72520 RepID=W7TUX0_9STRA|nr:hypothetical protein Naga_100192g11 [Nannochloropsis gaditana]